MDKFIGKASIIKLFDRLSSTFSYIANVPMQYLQSIFYLILRNMCRIPLVTLRSIALSPKVTGRPTECSPICDRYYERIHLLIRSTKISNIIVLSLHENKNTVSI